MDTWRLNMKAFGISGLLSFFVFLVAPVQAEIFIDLPTDKQVHHLDIETTENVVIQVNGDAFLQGSIKTDGGIIIEASNHYQSPGYGRMLRLNEGLVIDGYHNAAPSALSIRNLGAVYIDTPITVDGGFSVRSRSEPGDGGNRLEINKDMNVGGNALWLIFPDGGNLEFNGTYISEGVNVNIEGGVYNDNYGANFIVAKDATFSTGNLLVLAGNKKIVDGEIISKATVSIAGVGGPGKSQVKINNIRAINEESNDHYVEISGDKVDIVGDIESNAGRLTISGRDEIILYGGEVSAQGFLGIFADDYKFTAYGGILRSHQVCLPDFYNDYGLIIIADIVGCDRF